MAAADPLGQRGTGYAEPAAGPAHAPPLPTRRARCPAVACHGACRFDYPLTSREANDRDHAYFHRGMVIGELRCQHHRLMNDLPRNPVEDDRALAMQANATVYVLKCMFKSA